MVDADRIAVPPTEESAGRILTNDELKVWEITESTVCRRYEYDGLETFDLTQDQRRIRDAVAEKVRSGVYQFEQVPCAICAGDEFSVVASKDRYGLLCPIVACKTCGLLQTNPRMTPPSYASFYTDDFAGLYRGSGAPLLEHFQSRRRHGRRVLAYLRSAGALTGDPGQTLVADIGCSHGGVLSAFQEAGYQTVGLDLNEEYLEYGRRNHGLDLILGDLSTVDLPRPPDVILYCQVFEHIASPRAELDLLREKLNPGSRVYIEVPGVHNLVPAYHLDALRLFQNAHVYHYTRKTLANMFEVGGFRPLAMNDRVDSVFEMSSETAVGGIDSDYDSLMRWLHRSSRLERLYPTTLVRGLGRSILLTASRLRRASSGS